MSAVISPCGKYRYALYRGRAPRLTFMMANPSTADAAIDDPTIRRCLSFAAREGYKGLVVVNVYAFRATNPKELDKVFDPCGPFNGMHLGDAARDCKKNGAPLICAWGTIPDEYHIGKALEHFNALNVPLLCLGLTKGRKPRHPLYVRNDAPLIDYPN